MANASGAILTDRDRVLLTFVGVARYVSVDPDSLASYLVHGILRPPKAQERPRTFAVDALQAASIGLSMDEVEAALRRMGGAASPAKAAGGQGTAPALPVASLAMLRRFIHEEACGKPPEGGGKPRPEEGTWRASR
jgi:hypothetical protein